MISMLNLKSGSAAKRADITTWELFMHTAEPTPHANQFSLLKQRRFAPFFWTQFLGAANDNVFKFAFTVLVTYQLSVSWLPGAMAGLVIGALFILPFLLFSATSGQLADKYSKAAVMRFVKSLEIAIMLIAAFGFYTSNAALLLICIFLMGLHSTLFGPVKFAYLPQVLSDRELTGGNGVVEMGTFVAILLGNVAGGLLIAIPEVGPMSVAVACVGLALLGRLVAGLIPQTLASVPDLRMNWNPVSETWRNLRLAHENLAVFRALLGISWMWFFGAVFLSQFPSLAREVLHGDAHVASLLLVVFSLGIGTGSLLCEVLSRRQVEIGLVPLGAIGMSVFSIDLYFACRALPASELMSISVFLAKAAHWRVIADLALLSLFAGLYSVPMYALIQQRSQATHRARIIAANNILNALFMIASSVIAGALLSAGCTIPQIILFTGIANAAVATGIFCLMPEYPIRFVAWVVANLGYRFRVRGRGHIPQIGAAVLVCNHVSFVDAVLIITASPRPVYFLIDHGMFNARILTWIFRLAKAIPITPRSDDAAAYGAAFDKAVRVLQEGDLLCIFLEAGLSKDGQIQQSKSGIMELLDRAAGAGLSPPVVPMAMTHFSGSHSSRAARGAFTPVSLYVSAPITAVAVDPVVLEQRIADLLTA
jgi:1-acyl-sn-glycerol-3-phosphate acyltransferase/MFS family permease